MLFDFGLFDFGLFDFGLFDFGPVVISGTPGLPESPVAYAPRRTVLDKLLVDAAVDGGAEMREGFITAQGISDAFRDADLCATAIDT
jgi:hypothetical protein